MRVHLGDVTTHIFQGLKTGLDGVYIGDTIGREGKLLVIRFDELGEEHQLESALMKPLIKGGHMRRYGIVETRKRILFPYQSGHLIMPGLMEQQYPKAWRYLLRHKTSLQMREGGKMKGNQWYAYTRSQALDIMDARKIVTPDYYAHASYCLDEDGEYYFCGGGAGGYGILLKGGWVPEYVLGLLNSRLLDWYLRKVSVRAYQTAFMYVKKYIEQLPICPIDKSNRAHHDKLVSLAEQMLKLHKDLPKARTAHDKTAIERQIAATDKQIDQLVYELYGLTKEEIMIVEVLGG
jgi:hypothetical protein